HPHMRPLLPMPLFLDFTYALLVVGCNLAIALMFQRFDDKLERESLMKTNAESRLAYLKAQINPHFYMNMLNNIHGMIEIDQEKAQSMVLDMSRLMRYTLYDSSRPLIPLAEEVEFLQNYLRLMRQRYPADRLTITSQFPLPGDMHGISVPPLLSLVFIENAFKHGVSYRELSFVSVSVEVSGSRVRFSCMNSNHPQSGNHTEREGIGLRNVGQRLALLYGEKAKLDISPTDTTYTVNLSIPAHEIKDSDH
ncbi:MAG: sensor histidine kinase, partial [Muribaculaceae bacterium]|nr:sensor histidine kinase [Muribaculaceae bacterium]